MEYYHFGRKCLRHGSKSIDISLLKKINHKSVKSIFKENVRSRRGMQPKVGPVQRAPAAGPPRAPQPPPLAPRHSPVKPQKPLNVVSKVQESPKVINFEDRLKSIITSVLNEDQEQRKVCCL